MNIKEATEKWVKGFNLINQSIIEKALKENVDDFTELTPIMVGSTVYYDGDYCKVEEIDSNKALLKIHKKIIGALEIRTIIYNNQELHILDYNYDSEGLYFELDNDMKIKISELKTILFKNQKVNVTFVKDDQIEIDSYFISVNKCDIEFSSWFSMSKSLWTLPNSFDEEWVKSHIKEVAKCGFRIFEDEATCDIYLGIDGYGYDFYEKHWIPLYKARGLHWHDTDKF